MNNLQRNDKGEEQRNINTKKRRRDKCNYKYKAASHNCDNHHCDNGNCRDNLKKQQRMQHL